MLKKLIAVMAVIYSVGGYATERDESFYITPRLDFVNQLDAKESSDFGIGYVLDIGAPIHKFVSIENTVRYIDWNSDQFENNFLQYGASLKLTLPFTEKTKFGLAGGFITDLDLGNEARSKEVNPYVKLDVDYNINDNWAVVLGFNQSFSSNYLDQYAYSLGIKYRFYKSQSTIPPQLDCDCIITEEKVETLVQPIRQELKVVRPIIEEVPETKPVIKEEVKPTLDYVLKKSDYIYQICRQFNMSLDEFVNLNKDYFAGRDLDYVYPGEVVKVKNPNK